MGEGPFSGVVVLVTMRPQTCFKRVYAGRECFLPKVGNGHFRENAEMRERPMFIGDFEICGKAQKTCFCCFLRFARADWV
jgi:hypothetical protein